MALPGLAPSPLGSFLDIQYEFSFLPFKPSTFGALGQRRPTVGRGSGAEEARPSQPLPLLPRQLCRLRRARHRPAVTVPWASGAGPATTPPGLGRTGHCPALVCLPSCEHSSVSPENFSGQSVSWLFHGRAVQITERPAPRQPAGSLPVRQRRGNPPQRGAQPPPAASRSRRLRAVPGSTGPGPGSARPGSSAASQSTGVRSKVLSLSPLPAPSPTWLEEQPVRQPFQ